MQHSALWQSVVYAECHYAECHYAECLSAEKTQYHATVLVEKILPASNALAYSVSDEEKCCVGAKNQQQRCYDFFFFKKLYFKRTKENKISKFLFTL